MGRFRPRVCNLMGNHYGGFGYTVEELLAGCAGKRCFRREAKLQLGNLGKLHTLD